MASRRKVIQTLASLPFISAYLGPNTLSANPGAAAIVSKCSKRFF